MHIGIRADGGSEQGFGHLVRTRTLARELSRRGHRVTYLTQTPENARETCGDVNLISIPTDEAEMIATAAHNADVDALVVDCGAIPLADQRKLADALPLALILDDTGSTIRCDIVINGHIYARADTYDYEGEEPIWCVGSDYYLPDDEIRRLTTQEASWHDTPRRGLITMGGSDVADTTPIAMQAFDGTDVRVDVIVGPGFRNREKIDATARELDANFDVVENPPDLAERMFRADIAVTALGLTAYELLAMQTPFVGIPQATDQYPKATALRERAAAIVLDEEASTNELGAAVSQLLIDTELRRTLFERGREIIGSDGTATVCDRLETLG